MKLPQSSLSKKTKVLLPMIAAAGAAVGLGYAWQRLLRRPLPAANGRIRLQGITRPVEILRDQWGVPHIYAENEHDLYFAQGYVHAQDRLFQMDTFRRVGAGRTSELIGPAGLAGDRFARYFGWKKAAQAQVDGASGEVVSVMQAYSAGVNAFIAQGKLPVEFTLLAYKPELWRHFDTAAWGVVLAWGLSVNWEMEIIRSLLLTELGPQKTVDLTAVIKDEYATIVPDETIGRHIAESLLETCHQALSYMPLGTLPAGSGAGSNNWTVNGRHSASGRPILANDPHLPPIFPAFWYENHLVAGDLNVSGFTMPGVPGVVIGHNEQVAWGLTNAFPDVQDVFIERFHPDDDLQYEVDGRWLPVEIVTEEIKVRGRKPVIEEVRYTHHGPVISDILPDEKDHLSLQWSSYAPSNHLQAVLDMNKAANWPEFRESLRSWGFPSQNVVYADVSGNIGYMMPGLIPKRRKGAGSVPVPGWNREYDWDGWIPFEELPTLYNPADGVIVTANNRVQRSSYPHLLTNEWLPDYRARRIRELIDEHIPLTLESNSQIQSDTVSLQAKRFVQLAFSSIGSNPTLDEDTALAWRLLKRWDFDMRADQVTPTLYYGWLVHYVEAVIEQAAGLHLAEKLLRKSPAASYRLDPFLEIATEIALTWLESGGPDWFDSPERHLLPALAKTVSLLSEQYGPVPHHWQWGKFHRVELRHQLARVPGLGRAWKPQTIPAGGDGYTVNQSDIGLQFPPDPVEIIASCRLLIDVGEWDNSLAVLPGGQCEHPAGKHYQDSLADWRDGRYHPHLFSRQRIEAELAGTTILEPKFGGNLGSWPSSANGASAEDKG